MEDAPKLLITDLRGDDISFPTLKETEMDCVSDSDVATPTKEESVQTVLTESSDDANLIASEECQIGMELVKGEVEELNYFEEVLPKKVDDDEVAHSLNEPTCVPESDSFHVTDTVYPDNKIKPVTDALGPSKEAEDVGVIDENLNLDELKPDPPSQDSFASIAGALNTSVNLTARDDSIVYNSPIKPDPPEFMKAIADDQDDADESESFGFWNNDGESCSSDVRTTVHENKTEIYTTENSPENNASGDVTQTKPEKDKETSPSTEISAPFVDLVQEELEKEPDKAVAKTTINITLQSVSSMELAETFDSATSSPAQISNELDTEDTDSTRILPVAINVFNSDAHVDDDECSYEEIIVDDDDEFIEYVDDILDDEGFTEETYDSQDQADLGFIVNGNTSRSSLTEDHGFNGNTSKLSIGDNSFTKRPVIKSATQKALEQEEAMKKAEAEMARKNMEYRLARHNSFTRKDEKVRRQLEEEEAKHLRQEDEQEKRRIEMQERLARQRAEQAMALMAEQKEEELRQRLYNDEVRRQAAEAAAHRIAAEHAAREKGNAEKMRREREKLEKEQRDAKRKAMEEEVKLLQSKLAEAKLAAEEAKKKQVEEKMRLKAKVDAHRREKRRASVTNMTESAPNTTVEEPNAIASAQEVVDPASLNPPASPPTEAEAPTSTVYYSVDELRKQSVPGLDYKNREIYLHPDEFQKLFGMTRAEFNEHPKWKKTQMKRKLKLF
jgi:Villin headpiece domain